MLGGKIPSGQVFYLTLSLMYHVLPPLKDMTSGIPNLKNWTSTEFPEIIDFKSKLFDLSISVYVCVWDCFKEETWKKIISTFCKWLLCHGSQWNRNFTLLWLLSVSHLSCFLFSGKKILHVFWNQAITLSFASLCFDAAWVSESTCFLWGFNFRQHQLMLWFWRTRAGSKMNLNRSHH